MRPDETDTAVADLDEAAERHVIAALRKLHFSVMRRRSEGSGPTTVEAWSGTQHVFMHVDAALAPGEPAGLTPAGKQELRERAARAGGEAWEAKVVLGPGLELERLDWGPLEDFELGE